VTAGRPGQWREYDMAVGALDRFRSVGDAAVVASRLLATGEPMGRVWRFALTQMLDDYTSVLRREGVAAAGAMWEAAPQATGDSRVDAALAAMGEYLARRDNWPVPVWTRDPDREATPWWFVTDLKGLHPKALVESPLSFRRRGVFITRGALERV
jgi:hypothetical protein